MKKYIGVFDSGIGGLTTLKEIYKLLPNEDFIYYADSRNNPYGDKTHEELLDICKNIVNYFIKKDIKLIVIACNTATTKCIDELRSIYKDIIFVGTEPAIKPACEKGYKDILVMATPPTIKSDKVKVLVDKYKKDNQNITLHACKDLAHAIEISDNDKIDNILKDIFSNKKYDSIVLACTHYPHIKSKIEALNPNADIIDGNVGVANRVDFLLNKYNLKNNANYKGSIKIIHTLHK